MYGMGLRYYLKIISIKGFSLFGGRTFVFKFWLIFTKVSITTATIVCKNPNANESRLSISPFNEEIEKNKTATRLNMATL